MNNSERIEALERGLDETRKQLETVAGKTYALEAIHYEEFKQLAVKAAQKGREKT